MWRLVVGVDGVFADFGTWGGGSCVGGGVGCGGEGVVVAVGILGGCVAGA